MEEMNQIIRGLETLKKYIGEISFPVTTCSGEIIVYIVKPVGAVEEYWLGEWGWRRNKYGDEWVW